MWIRKMLAIVGIFGFVLVCLHTSWIEDIFNLNFCMGEAQNSYLLALIASVLILKK